MQQQQVGWDPDLIRTVLPWQFKLLVLYFVVVFVLWLVRFLRLGRQLWFSGKNREMPELSVLLLKVASLKRLAALSLLVTTLQSTWRLTDFLQEVSNQKAIGIGALSGGLAELLASVTLGVMVSTILYESYMLYQHALARRGVNQNFLGGRGVPNR